MLPRHGTHPISRLSAGGQASKFYRRRPVSLLVSPALLSIRPDRDQPSPDEDPVHWMRCVKTPRSADRSPSFHGYDLLIEAFSRLNQQIAALLFMDTCHKKKKAAISCAWTGRKKNFSLTGRIAIGSVCSVGHHDSVPAVQAKAQLSLLHLSLRGEKHCQGVTQHWILKRAPVQKFFQVFERICLLKPRIQRAVNKHCVWNSALNCAPSGKAVVLPDAIDYDSVILINMCPQPGEQSGRVSVNGFHR